MNTKCNINLAVGKANQWCCWYGIAYTTPERATPLWVCLNRSKNIPLACLLILRGAIIYYPTVAQGNRNH